jgi:GxxExxY protein
MNLNYKEEETTKYAKGAKMGMDIIFKEESYRVIGACFEVYKEKGNGFLEAVYQECLAIEFAELGIPFVMKPRLLLEYKGRELKQIYEPDFLCFDNIILEIKAVSSLADEHRAQIINYLKATGKQLGLLVNFGHHPGIEHERFINQPSRETREGFSRLSRIS